MTRGADLGCRAVDARMADYLADSLTAAEITEIEAHCAGCGRCRHEVESMRKVWRGLGGLADEQPSAVVRARFEAMLTGHVEAETAGRRPWKARFADWWRGWWPGRARPASPAWQAGLTLAALVAGVVVGGGLAPRRNAELDELRTEVADLSRLVGLSLLEQGSASDRLRGVGYSRRNAASDPEVLAVLLRTVRQDPDVNVRLAAIDALAGLVDRAPVLDGLRDALAGQDAALVQLAMIDVLLAADGSESRAAVRRLLADDRLDDTVRRYVAARLDTEV